MRERRLSNAVASLLTGLSVLLVSPEARADPVSETSGNYDWCAPVVVRARTNWRSVEPCVPGWSEAEIAAGAEIVLVSGSLPPGTRRRCGGPGTHEGDAAYIASIRSLREATGGGRIRFIHMHRFDLVKSNLAALPGFDPDYLLRPLTSWDRVRSFFASDRSEACRDGGCRWDLGRFEQRREPGSWLRDLIDLRSEPGRHREVVYYLGRGSKRDTRFGPVAALADLRNPEYRAWRVAEAKRTLSAGSYDAVMLNHKFLQYWIPGFWIGSPRYPDVTVLRESRDTVWSAQPRRYGFADYAAGWVALAHDLKEAGVPYAVNLSPRWLFGADAPSTPEVNESQAILSAAREATIVLLDIAHPGRIPLPAMIEDLETGGAFVEVIDTSCGAGQGEPLWSKLTEERRKQIEMQQEKKRSPLTSSQQRPSERRTR